MQRPPPVARPWYVTRRTRFAALRGAPLAV